ncbi:unnamed protein product [Phytophthora fragariaefolia]|uniref:Unnamed protein product n=1 Tax=Phytophthora fragariaefolia TaxID=1490495 RepID=A0A9W6TWN7_9STRA|nr:unnamed protein product [Phytophthora fragariaefolia]
MVPTGQFSMITYRLNPGYAEIKLNGGAWGGESPPDHEAGERRLRITMNDVVSLGNSKSACDTNAFQGRVAEVLIYDTVLDDAKVEAVERYIHDKWWGDKPFPETAPVVAATSAPESAPPELGDRTEEPATTAPDPVTIESTEDATASTAAPATTEAELEPASEEPSEPEQLQPVGADGTSADTAAQEQTPLDAAPAPKFDPLVNIFEWTAPGGSDAAKAEQWARSVRARVEAIRNFQLGGPVLRALIRQHKDELEALREQLFG